MRSPTVARAAALLTLAIAAPGAAQNDSASTRRWCWRGRPMPQCDAFWITESDADVVMSTTTERATFQNGPSTSVQHSRHFMNRWEVTIGPMVNTAPLRAIGGTLSISPLYNDGYRVAGELRRRWWSPEGSALDLTVGPVARDVRHLAPRRSDTEYGLTAAAYLVGGDYINANARLDLLLTSRKPIVGTSWGAGFGSRPAVYATIIGGLGFLFIIYAFNEAT